MNVNVLQEADELIHGERAKAYGNPRINHGCTAALISALLSNKYRKSIVLDADDVCWFNICQKMSREANEPKRDNLVDVCGYVGNIEMMLETPETTPHHPPRG